MAELTEITLSYIARKGATTSFAINKLYIESITFIRWKPMNEII